MKQWVNKDKPTVDLYSGVGTIGLTIGGDKVIMVEINENAVNETRRNIKTSSNNKSAKVVLSSSESALEYISSDATIIVDPPRAGLHMDVIEKLLVESPERIIYLSCNPVTQARDVALLSEKYGILYHRGYNFFPKTPHIEHLVILDLKK
jgi:23S rRNA (uracil1939-C5)-methyltransferase